MADLDLNDDERVVGCVSVYRVLIEDGGMRDEIRTDDGFGGEIDLPTAVGMLAIAQHTLLCDVSTPPGPGAGQ